MPKFEFSWKKGLCQFLNIPIIYHHVKRSEKTNEPLLKKMPNWQTDRQRQIDRQTDRQTDKQTDRQTDNSDWTF